MSNKGIAEIDARRIVLEKTQAINVDFNMGREIYIRVDDINFRNTLGFGQFIRRVMINFVVSSYMFDKMYHSDVICIFWSDTHKFTTESSP